MNRYDILAEWHGGSQVELDITKDEQGEWVKYEDVERLKKKFERQQQGTNKLIKKLLSGEEFLAPKDIFEKVIEWGFEVEELELPPYQGNLPVEERVEYKKFKLKRG